MRIIRTLSVVAAMCLLAACGDKTKDHKDHGHKDHNHDHDHNDDHHAHESPRGGTLVELGDHFAQLDFVIDSDLKTFSLYVMDAHAENPVRIAQESVEILLPVPKQDAKGEPGFTVALKAVANENTGEKVGDTSKFSAPLDDLKGMTAFDASIKTITVKGRTFTDVVFTFPKPKK